MTGLAALLHRAEWPDPRFTADELAGWPAGEREAAARFGLLADAPLAAAVRCPGCDRDHVEPVHICDSTDRPRRWFVACPEAGRVWVTPAQLKRWVVGVSVLADQAAGAVGAAGPVVERVGGRVWKLGRVRAGGRAWVGWLAVGLGQTDGPTVAAGMAELRAANALVFVPAVAPPPAVWTVAPPAVVPLVDVLALGPAGLMADRGMIAAAVGPPRAARVDPTAVRLPPGTEWADVVVEVDDLHLIIRAGAVAKTVGFADAGFEDHRKRGVPNAGWRLLALFARHRGELTPPDNRRTKAGGLKTGVSALRVTLQSLTGLTGDPFQTTRPGRPYRTRFRVRCVSRGVVSLPPSAGWDDITLAADGPDRVRVGVGDEPAGVYTMTELGLADPDGRPTPAGRALGQVLAAGGRVTAGATDPGLLALSGALSKAVPATGKPFEYDPGAGVWMAAFHLG